MSIIDNRILLEGFCAMRMRTNKDTIRVQGPLGKVQLGQGYEHWKRHSKDIHTTTNGR